MARVGVVSLLRVTACAVNRVASHCEVMTRLSTSRGGFEVGDARRPMCA